MKKWIIFAALAMFLLGCSHAPRDPELNPHNAHFKNWEHMKFSLWGYRNPTPETLLKSQEQGWWGADVPYIPAE
jgi:hypothetical protein